MRSNTEIVMGINNVGDSKDRPEIFNGTFAQSIVHLAKWISERSIASRIDIVLARSEEEARQGLRIREQDNGKTIIDDSIMDVFQSILDENQKAESDA